MLVRLTKDTETADGFKLAGNTVEHPDAHWLVRMGSAEPADQQSQEKHDEYLAERDVREHRRSGVRPTPAVEPAPQPAPKQAKSPAAETIQSDKASK